MISGALSLSEALGLTSWIGRKLGGDTGEKTAQVISGIAQEITGTDTDKDAILSISKNPELAKEIRLKVMDNEQELRLAYLADLKDARAMYTNTDHTMADSIAKSVMRYNVLAVLALIGVLVGIPYLNVDAGTMTMLGGVVGGCITSLWNERATAISFFLGSSKSSADKTDSQKLKR